MALRGANRGSVPTDRETSIRRGIEVLLSLGSDEALRTAGWASRASARCSGREKSQVSRALKALAEYGLVERNRDALTYRLGWRIYALAQLAGEPRLLEEAATAAAAPRHRDAGARALLRPAGRRGPDAALRVSRPRRRGRRLGRAGDAGLLHLRGPGAALRPRPRRRSSCSSPTSSSRAARETRPTDVAALHARIAHGRERGVVARDDEFEAGLVAAAAPVRDAGGAIVGALNVSAPIVPRRGPARTSSAPPCWPPPADLGAALAAGNDAPGGRRRP